MSYKVISPLVAVAPAEKSGDLDDANQGPRYFYEGAVIPDGYNDKRCKELVDDGMLEKVSAASQSSDSGDDKDPTRSSSKADWVAYATDDARGESKLSKEEAESLTRDQLVEKYLGPKE